ncbi:unnamed protein product [Cylindrotheca closterium]|uniref:Uncharacterized protein n=1 Tax=Cylindrotheca closterium TaxID=2856 RepID=A0AAD2CQ35_9STRA|nr:unnamed protein product [Cylindrotheca closterium]
MKSPPILNRANQDPELQAAEARAAGESIIRDHLDNHLVHNSGASSEYISWIATLHPENAQIEIDERFFIPGNPWWSIYEQTVNMPCATAVAVPAADGEREAHPPNAHQYNATSDGEAKYVLSTTTHASDDLTEQSTPADRQEEPEQKLPHYCLRSSPVDMCIALITTFHATFFTLVFEFSASIFYFVAASFYHIAQVFSPSNMFTGFFYSIFMIMYFAFAAADSALLLGSVLGTEAAIFVGWILGVLFGGIWVANKRHQFVRRVCHRIRWAFRHKHLEPPRTFCKQSQVGTELVDQCQNTARANAELDTEFEIDDSLEAQEHVEPAYAQHREESPPRTQTQPKEDFEQKSAKPY